MRPSVDNFLSKVLPGYSNPELIAGDASFRKYYRTTKNNVNYIVMDAPSPHEDAGRFVQVATAFSQAGMNVPNILEDDIDNGYLLISDFGDETLQQLMSVQASRWLTISLERLFELQTCGGQHILELPLYDNALLLRELSLFPEWFITELLNDKLNAKEETLLTNLNCLLIDNALNQPQTWVHRDYHSRNLMKTSESDIGILDFQDAVLGPITYDLVSILKDCYVRHSKKTIHQQLEQYYFKLVASERYYQDFEQFQRHFDLTGLQRHLKVLGLFARLSIRDSKHHYLNDLPLVFDYVFDVVQKYQELNAYLPLFERLGLIFEQKVLS